MSQLAVIVSDELSQDESKDDNQLRPETAAFETNRDVWSDIEEERKFLGTSDVDTEQWEQCPSAKRSGAKSCDNGGIGQRNTTLSSMDRLGIVLVASDGVIGHDDDNKYNNNNDSDNSNEDSQDSNNWKKRSELVKIDLDKSMPAYQIVLKYTHLELLCKHLEESSLGKLQ
ncbi:hypothetical protein RFI_07668 [Reticulomyxa filosa]|uniref:Uncharacterized protein n=1 Tax=Reticulomyxa filosa TaxID=46433 RepID=X6NW10_RETFI|nr:hypothetical protein RFI_07668 [Reticulomyxa filosa]|eukprot:ETO29452.1 hypothetical protein RFI_07668 [Reticulomyxa filosa]